MTIFLKDLANGEIVPYSSEQIVAAITTMVVGILAIPASLTSLYSLLKQRNLDFDSYYLVSLTAADFLFSLHMLIYGSLEGASILSVFSMTLHKYLSIIKKVRLAHNQVIGVIVAAWALPTVITIVFNFIGDLGTLNSIQSSGGYCFVAMNNPNNFKSSIIILLIIVGTLLFIAYAHIVLVLAYRKWIRMHALSLVSNQVIMHPIDPEQLQKERRLISKSIAISAVFFLSWVLFVVKIVIEMASLQSAPAIYDIVTQSIAVSTPVINVFILYYYDPKFRVNMREVLRLDKLQDSFTTYSIKSKDASKRKKITGMGQKQSQEATRIMSPNEMDGPSADTVIMTSLKKSHITGPNSTFHDQA